MNWINKIAIWAFPVIFVNCVEAQVNHCDYFTISAEDLNRWEFYSNFIDNSPLDSLNKADSIYNFAQVEFHKAHFSKVRELCEIANLFNPELAKTHLLTGKAYVSSVKICREDDPHFLMDSLIWLAIEEWKICQELGEKDNKVKKLIDRYSRIMLTREEFTDYYDPHKKLKEGEEYFVSCWIQRNTKIRFGKDN